MYQALVEVDGPWWGEHLAALLRQLCSVEAASAGVDAPPDDFRIRWTVGRPSQPAEQLLPANDGLEIFAARYGLAVEESPP